MTPLLFSSFLSFPFLLPLQEQSPSRSIPSLALELNAQHDAGENISELLNSSWESSNIQDKVSLLHASSRAFPNTPEHAKLLERCLLHSDPQLQKEAALLSGFLSPNFVPAYALADLLVSTTDKGVFSAATQTSWASGLYARPSFPPPTKESILVLRTQIQEGKPPLHGVAWILQNQKGLRTDYLNSLLAKALPETELASLLEVTIESWAPLDRFLFQALLLDQGLEKEKAAHWTASWWQHLAPSESTNPSHQALWAALDRHAWALNAQALDLGPNRTIDSEGTRFLIHQAPSSISNSTLFKWAQDTELDSSLRTQCILKLLRSEGNIWAPRLLSLLQESQDEAILNALSIGMVPWVSQEVLEAFRKRIVHIPPQAAGYAALILCKHGTHEERMRFLPKLPSLQSTATA
ncbi:MAG: hypothetical protein QF524_05130, partial [Planctomycetota bacterium]|nr:hypothetical protein [Planctomycetota bacterium]